jgi:hypothetical protein
VNNPYYNRDIILKITKRQKGVYIWETLDGNNIYLGHSINLYNRISSYFMPCMLKTKAGRVLRYLNKHGFNNRKQFRISWTYGDGNAGKTTCNKWNPGISL